MSDVDKGFKCSEIKFKKPKKGDDFLLLLFVTHWGLVEKNKWKVDNFCF